MDNFKYIFQKSNTYPSEKNFVSARNPEIMANYKTLLSLEENHINEFVIPGKGYFVRVRDLTEGSTSEDEGYMPDEPDPPVPPKPQPSLGGEAKPHPPAWQMIAAGAIGVFFVATLLTIAVAIPNPTQFQIFIFRAVLALAAGGLGALIPGFLEVKFRNWIRAGGAMGLFALVYLVNPPALIVEARDRERNAAAVAPNPQP
jgi:hypothetical protein